jgi:predicted nucleic acid-binding protein
LDTNVLIRHLTGDPPEMAARATALLAGGEPLLMADLVFAECIDVLESFYEVHRARVAVLMRSALSLENLKTTDPGLLRRALEVYELDRLDFAEAGLPGGPGQGHRRRRDRFVYRTFDRVKSVRRREP